MTANQNKGLVNQLSVLRIDLHMSCLSHPFQSRTKEMNLTTRTQGDDMIILVGGLSTTERRENGPEEAHKDRAQDGPEPAVGCIIQRNSSH